MSDLQSYDRPLLVDYYIDAVREVYGVPKRIGKKHYEQFRETEAELMFCGIGPKHYAITVAKLWKAWCAKQGLETVPVNVFLGKRSRDWYDSYAIFAVDVVSASKVRSIVANDEFRLAQTMVQAAVRGEGRIRESRFIEDLGLSYHWHRAADAGCRPIRATAETVAGLFGIECITLSYAMLGRIIRDRRIQIQSAI